MAEPANTTENTAPESVADPVRREPNTIWDSLPEGISGVVLDFNGHALGMTHDEQAETLRGISDALAKNLQKNHGVQPLQGDFGVDPRTNTVFLTMTVMKSGGPS